MYDTLVAFAAAIGLFLLFIPLWPFGLAAFIEWQRTPLAPTLETA